MNFSDGASAAALATVLGTPALAVAPFASVRSANRAGKISCRTMPRRNEDRPELR